MPARFHNVNNVKTQFTQAEEDARDAEEAAFAAGAEARALKRVQDTRRLQYQETTDDIFFKEQAGEVPVGTWATARAAVKIANPKG